MLQALENEGTLRQVHGRVAWFSSSLGYGFMQADYVAGDILIHQNVLKNFGRSSVAAETQIDAHIRQTPNGLQVAQIIAIGGDEDDKKHEESVGIDASDHQPARVKWYDEAKGFGFVNLFHDPADYFVHSSQLDDAGLSNLFPGEAITVVPSNGPRGATISELRAWI